MNFGTMIVGTGNNSAMKALQQCYIGGKWVNALGDRKIALINPATEAQITTITAGSDSDVDRAVKAARHAANAFSQTSVTDRLDLLTTLSDNYKKRQADIAHALSLEMGAPIDLARSAQVKAGRSQIKSAIRTLKTFIWHRRDDYSGATITFEPIGVCGLITPWNWPMNQIAAKVAPAVAAGCTSVLKPSELAPLSGQIFAQLIADAGFPDGVFNLVHGDGAHTGTALCAHADVDMISLTGSVATGRSVSTTSAHTIKRVTLELGGKSAALVFADADLHTTIKRIVKNCLVNSGQSCNAPTRLLVQASVYDKAVARAKEVSEKMKVGDPQLHGTQLGPVVSKRQFDRICHLIESGISDGATLLTGGTSRPDGLTRGYYIRPTIFTDVTRHMDIVQQEIFGPVLCIMPFENEDAAVKIANDTAYGLAAYVYTQDKARAARIAAQLRCGMVRINGAPHRSSLPFGGYRQSGNGREYGEFGLMEYLEVKAISGL